MDITFAKERLEKLKTSIVAYDDAISAIIVGGMQSYKLDDGQTAQSVTKLNISEIENRREKLYAQYEILYNKIYGGSAIIARPHS